MFAKFPAHNGCSINGSNCYHSNSYDCYLLVVGVGSVTKLMKE